VWTTRELIGSLAVADQSQAVRTIALVKVAFHGAIVDAA
jgi:hypothetical protein